MVRNCMNVGMSQSIVFEYSRVVYCLFTLKGRVEGSTINGWFENGRIECVFDKTFLHDDTFY